MIEHYISFDFETATGKNPCSIGIVEFKEGRVVNEYYSLINPMVEKFNPFTTRIHGITAKDVQYEKTFDKVWDEIKHFFENQIIIAHNSSFDLSVLEFSLNKYNIEIPSFKCYCTLRLSRKILDLDNYKLSTLSQYYGIVQNNYHNALEDAFVCGNVFSNLLLEVQNINQIIKNDYKPLKTPKKQINEIATNELVSNKEESISLRVEFLKLFNVQTEKLKGQTFVVSGVFETISRNELKKLIEDNGGKVSSSISSKTTYLVAGDKMGPSKRTKAENLNIPIISEEEFLSNLK